MADNVIRLFGAHRPLPRAVDPRWAGISDDDLRLTDMAYELVVLANRLADRPADAPRALALAAAHLAHDADVPAAAAATLAERLANTIHDGLKG